MRTLAGGVIPVASRLPVYEELLADGEYGDGFIPGDIETLGSHLTRLVSAPPRRDPAQLKALRSQFSWSRVTDDLEDVPGRWSHGVTMLAATPASASG